MLDAFIIEQIRRREEQEQERTRRQPALEIPSRFPMQRPPGWSDAEADRSDRDRDGDEDRDRGFAILDM
ncbi:MAG: hypothetical protein ACOYOB_04090 [Myxococcota bacterium]